MSEASDEPAPAHRGWLIHLLGLMSAVLTVLSLVFFGLFLLCNGFDLIRLDRGGLSRLLFNGMLSLAFFIQHSGMIRRSFRRWLSRWIPREYIEHVYAIVSALVLALVILLWQGPLTVLCSAAGPARWVIRGLFVLGLALFGAATLVFIKAGPFGWEVLRKRSESGPSDKPPLLQDGPYRWVRHPSYLATLLLIWSAPDLTADRLVFNVIWSAWILVGIMLEERDLAGRYGEAYRDYQHRVPMLLPWPRRSGS